MSFAVVVQIRLRDVVMILRGMIAEGGEFAMKAERAYLRGILKAHTAGTEGLISDGQGKFAGFVESAAHDEVVFAHQGFRFEADVLDVYGVNHQGSFGANDETG